jgi:membrane protease YdiL (CAAX protease family)
MQFSLDSSTALFLYWIVLFMPLMAWASYRKIKSGTPLSPKVERFRMAVAILIVTGLIGVATARANLIPLSFSADLASLVLGVAVLTGLLAGIARGRHRVPAAHRERIRLLYAPATPAEFSWSIVGGIAAGITEEIAYRAVLYELVGRWAGYGISIIVCVLLFVLAHLPQGLRGGIGVGAMAILFHIIYVLSGSLLAPILVHALYDIGLFAMLFLDERRQALASASLEQPVLAN